MLYENLMDDRMEYTLSFQYDGYNFNYNWLEDPETAQSYYVSVSRPDVPVTAQ